MSVQPGYIWGAGHLPPFLGDSSRSSEATLVYSLFSGDIMLVLQKIRE